MTNKNLEKEIRGEIDKDTFDLKVKEFSNKFGNPKQYTRLSLLLFDRDKSEIDTRIRITNGQAELMQKIKIEPHVKHSPKEEIAIPINNNPETIYKAYKILENLFYNSKPKRMFKISAETKNYLWNSYNCEIKLSHLFGKFDFYNYEIEALESKVDLQNVETKLGLKDILEFSSKASKKRRRELATFLDQISKKEFIDLIQKYL